MSVTLLVVLTVIEIVALVAVLAVYVVLVTRRLRSVAGNLARVAFGVRAVETQVKVIEPAALRVNAALQDMSAALPGIAQKAERLAR